MLRILLLIVATATLCFGQTAASLRGVVKDKDGAPVAAAKVEIVERATGKVKNQQTNGEGEFFEPILTPGVYDLTTRADKFKDYESKGLNLTVGQQAQLRITMSTVEDVIVADAGAAAAQVNLSSGSMTYVVGKDEIRDLPLNGRSFEQLALLQPGVVAAYSAGSSFYGARTRAISVNGARPEQNSFLVDGVDMMNAFNKTPGSAAGVLLGVEGVQEYQVLANSYSPEFGRAAGGVINAASRYGSNQLNGSLFYFLRNSAFDAKNYFTPVGQSIPGFKRNQFGGVIGGPIVKNKTFFFGSYESLIERLGVISSAAVPDAAARLGQLPSGTVPVNPIMRPYLDKLFPASNGASLGGGAAEYRYSLSQPTDDRFYTARLDHRFSDKDNFFARYTMTEGTVDRVPANTLPVSRLLETGRNQYIGTEWVRMISPSLFMINRAAFSRSASSTVNNRTVQGLDALSFVPGSPFGFLTVTGMATSIGGDARVPRQDYLNNYQLASSWMWIKGRHSIKFGSNVQRQHFNTYNTLQEGGAVTFASLGDFLRGTARSIDYSVPGFYDAARGFRQTLFGGFLTDEFRIKENLTVNIGVRYDMATVPTEVNGKTANLRQITDSQITVGDPYFNNPSIGNFAPRVSIAWAPRKSQVWAIRSGFGIFNDLIMPRYYFIAATRNPPFSNRILVNNPSFPLSSSDLANWRSARPSVNSMDPNLANPYTMQFNFTVDRIWRSWNFSSSYVGTRGLHLPRQAEANLAPSSFVNGVKTYNPAAGRLNPAWAGVVRTQMDSQSTYHAFQFSASKRMSHGVRGQLAYTWSKSIDDASGIISSDFNTSTQYTMDYTDRKLDRGLSSFHAGHVLVMNGSWDLPWGRKAKGWHKHVTGGWQLHNITTVQSGHPFSLLMGFNRSGNLNTASLTFHDRPDVNPNFSGNVITGDPRRYWDINAVRMPAANVRGNMGRNTLIGPGLLMVDAALVKQIVQRERTNIVFRAEVFNAGNRPNFAAPSGRTAFTNAQGGVAANQGQITSTVTSSRQIQFGLKWLF